MLLGGAASNVTSQWLIKQIGWRWSFPVFALVGVGWAAAFYLWFRDDPADHPQANDAERRLIAAGRMPGQSLEGSTGVPVDHKSEAHGPIPWAQVLSCANVWLLSGAIITMSALYELMNSWYPTYLQQGAGPRPTTRGG